MTVSLFPFPARLPAVRLTVSGLVVDRGGRRVLDGLDLTLGPGEAILLTGPNGIGKSTLIRALFGLVRHDGGRLEISGDEIESGADLAPSCHYLGHRDALKSALSVAENLRFWQAFLGAASGLAVDDALEAVDLLELADLPAAYLSAGQRRRLAIARLLVSPRPIWLLDEPTAALDRTAEDRLVAIMAGHLAVGGSLIAATHLPIALPGARGIRLGRPQPSAADATA
jgi:heme exporter protein A